MYPGVMPIPGLHHHLCHGLQVGHPGGGYGQPALLIPDISQLQAGAELLHLLLLHGVADDGDCVPRMVLEGGGGGLRGRVVDKRRRGKGEGRGRFGGGNGLVGE